jgi:divinyl chlorophyllide a 8-vinyl-reductase
MSRSPGTIVLAGATGYIGRAVASELLNRGYRVVAPVRQLPGAGMPQVPDGCDVRVAAITNGDAITAALDDVEADAVISCIASRNGEPEDAWRVDYGANSKLLAAAAAAGVRHFVLLSAICVQKPALAFQHAKLAFEKELIDSDLTWSIVRPTAFFKSISGQVDRVRAGKPFIVFGTGTETACKPISEADLARYLVDCLDDPGRHNRILPVGGPGDALTPLDQGALLFELAGRSPRYRHVSPRLFRLMLALLAPFARISQRAAAKAELARIGHYYATESMLSWDDESGRYDADATPSTGTDTLRDHYARVLREGSAGQELGEHKLF